MMKDDDFTYGAKNHHISFKIKNMSSKKSKIIKIIILVAVILLLVLLSIELLPLFKNLTTVEGRQEIETTLKNMGPKGIFVLLGLMIAQVLLAVLPGEPVELLAGMCYGPLGGTLIVIFGAFLSTVLIFFAVRKFGRDFIYTFANKEKIEQLEKSKWFSNPKRLEIIFLILFLVPGTPKDLLVYIGGLLPVHPMRFILISTLARIPAVISLTVIGDNILEGNWRTIGIVIAVTIAITLIAILSINKKDKTMAKDMFEK